MAPKTTGSRAFSRLLDDALKDAVIIREHAEALAGDVLVASPYRVYESAIRLEEHSLEGQTRMSRLIEVMRRAHLHTLETAYRMLAVRQGRTADAQKLRTIIDEYQQAKSVMDLSREHIEAAIGSLADQRWRSLSVLRTGAVAGHVGDLIAKA